MTAQWENECIPMSVLPMTLVQSHAAVVEYFEGFSLAANPSVAKMAQSPPKGLTQPLDVEELGLDPTMERQ